MRFSGTVEIRGRKIGRPSQRLTFHQKGLKVTTATIRKHDKKGDHELQVVRINNQNSLNEVRLHTQEKVFAGEYTVTLEFNGQINRHMNGIYPCFFKHDGADKVLIATQFESHHAREAFPCIDEPEAKATFDLTLTTPVGETVIANTPVREQREDSGSLTTAFETTPRMSTYLLAFAFGELGYTESRTKDGVTVRAYATPDNVKLTEYGLSIAVRALEFFSDYFGIPYPLKKLDMLALPDFSSGAMENWGLVTYRETAMLADEATTSIDSKQLVALVIAHELSHQWFGNLVTMKWWDDLWLNESFANLMEYRAIDSLHPEWHIFEQFVANEGASAKRRDSLADVQPIRMAVNHPDEISTLFDPSIVYAKGGSVLYMLKQYIGEAAFRRGLGTYFEQHQYGNTTAADLWHALGEAAGRDITEFMAGWLNRPGYPLVSVDWQPGGKTVKLTQRRFVGDPSQLSLNDEPWQVPLAATWQLAPELLAKTEQTSEVVQASQQPLLLNHDGASYMLPRYANPEHLRSIVEAIAAGQVATIDRLLLLDNYNLLQRGGEAATTELLALMAAYKQETEETVLGSLALGLGEVRRLVEGDPSEAMLDAFIGKLVNPLVEEVGWQDAKDDDAQRLRLRSLVLSLAAGAKVPAVLDSGLQQFGRSKQPADLAPSTRGVVYYIAARYGSSADFEKLLAMHHTNQNADEREELAAGLTSAKQPRQYRQLLELLKSDEVRRQDLMHWWVWLLRNRYSRQAAWDWLTGNWDWVEQEFASDKSYSYFARYAGSLFSRPQELVRYNEFFEPKRAIVALGRDISLGQQEIASRIAWRQRNEQAVRDWLNQL